MPRTGAQLESAPAVVVYAQMGTKAFAEAHNKLVALGNIEYMYICILRSFLVNSDIFWKLKSSIYFWIIRSLYRKEKAKMLVAYTMPFSRYRTFTFRPQRGILKLEIAVTSSFFGVQKRNKKFLTTNVSLFKGMLIGYQILDHFCQ